MAAPITYEGVLAPKEPLRNGLFKNMKFWVAHRIPQRLNIVQMIQVRDNDMSHLLLLVLTRRVGQRRSGSVDREEC